jgi:hypothetical protein
VKQIARILPVVSQARDSVDEDARRPDGGGLLEEKAVRLLHFLPEDVARREHDLQSPASLELMQVPAQAGRVARELVGRNLEQNDHPGLIELAGAAIDHFDAKRGLAGSDGAFQQDDVAAWNAASQDGIQSGDSGPNQVGSLHRNSWSRRGVTGRP